MRILFMFWLLPFQLFSQELEGVWTGTIFNDTTRKFIPYEIVITESKGKLSGFSHTIFIGEDNKQETGIKSLKIKKKAASILIEDDELIYNNYDAPPPKGVRQYSILNFASADSGLMLIGVFNTNRTKEYASLTGTIKLKKKEKFEETKIISKLEELKISQSLSFIQAKKKRRLEELANTEKAYVTVQLPSAKKGIPTTVVETKASVKKEKDKNLLDINEDVIDYKVDVVETAEVNKEKKKKQVEVAAATIKLEKKTETIIPQQKIAAIVDKANNPVATTAPEKKENAVVKKTVQVVSKEKPAIVTTEKVTAQPTIIAQPDKNKTKTEQIKKAETVILSKEKINPNPVPLEIKPAKRTLSIVTPLISANEIAKRKIETIRTVDFKTDSLVLTLYDNGVVDGDTVSVILNGKVIMSKQRLTTTAINKTIFTSAELGDSLQLILYAENLGSIPPNTGLLIIQDGSDQYQIRFAGDLKKNAAINLRRKRN